MAEFIRVASRSKIPDGAMWAVAVHGRQLLLINETSIPLIFRWRGLTCAPFAITRCGPRGSG
jgi:hypothetical protein